ncbi:TetR family transcriptional regulator [Pseudomonas taiwanensis]|uniref:TetR family transcriptional regulator n=1 Tax=Pseudomonas taiwanensis TaxID=470150 RepID=UPI0016451918|nr:TetR/AcrR family transcriptional regulator [Pseudomonas taiwanensis]
MDTDNLSGIRADGGDLLDDRAVFSSDDDARTSDYLGPLHATAVELFLIHGYESVSLRQIADQAGVKQGSIHKATGGKDELLAQLLLDYEAGLLDQLSTTVPKSLGTLQALDRFVEVVVSFGVRRRDHHRLTRREVHRLSGRHAEELKQLKGKQLNRLWEILAVGAAKKVFHRDDTRFIAKTIFATLDGVLLNRTVSPTHLDEFLPILQRMARKFASVQ